MFALVSRVLIKIKEKIRHVKVVENALQLEMHTGRYLTGHDIVTLMLSSFFRKSTQKTIDLSNV
jgi:hypothetical protein